MGGKQVCASEAVLPLDVAPLQCQSVRDCLRHPQLRSWSFCQGKGFCRRASLFIDLGLNPNSGSGQMVKVYCHYSLLFINPEVFLLLVIFLYLFLLLEGDLR